MKSIIQEIRYSLRTLFKKPGFTFVVILTLALGIGANTAIFSIVNAILLKPLPFQEPQRLIEIRTVNLSSNDSTAYEVASPADFKDWQEQSQTLDIAAMRGGGQTLTLGEHPEIFRGADVSANFFEVLGVKPLYGRTFNEEEATLNGPNAVILSYRLWQERFGGDPTVIGRTFKTPTSSATIIGVMPATFKYPYFADTWSVLAKDSPELRNRGNRYVIVTARIKDGQSLDRADAEMKAIAARLEETYPQTNKNITTKLVQLRESITGSVQSSLFVLLGAVGLVLLIACANVASLLLTHAESRHKEIAIRLALGAHRWQLIRQLLTESVILALLGGAFGLLLALWGLDFLLSLLPKVYSPAFQTSEVRIDYVVLLFALVASVLTGIIFGLVPAWQASRPQLNEALKESSRSSQGIRRQRTRSILIIGEVALALVLLVGAGLLMQSFSRLRSVDLGYDANNLLTMNIHVPFSKYPSNEARAQLFQQMLEKISETTGVESVALTSGVPFGYLGFPFNLEDKPFPAGAVNVRFDSINPGYFHALKARMLAGREFDEHDTRNSQRVAIINESLAKTYFNDRDAIGRQITIDYLGSPEKFQIVGIVSDIKQEDLREPAHPQLYVSYKQLPWLGASFVVRPKNIRAESLKNEVQNAIWAVDKDQPASKGETISVELNNLIEEPRLYTTLLSIFAALALILAAVGIYGVVSYSVAQRTQEIGIRVALGASRSNILKMVIWQGMWLIIAGVAFGTVVALALTRLLASLLFNVGATNPITFLSVAVIIFATSILACSVPALRATKVDPLVALRCD